MLLWGIAFLVSCGVAGGLCFLHAGRYLESAQQAPHPADLIVCLGGDWGERTKKAAQLYRQGYAGRILLVGPLQLPAVAGQPRLGDDRVQALVALGVPREAILVETQAGSSREEAARTLALMVRQGWHHALVVSDPPHMRRLSWLWERQFTASGREFTLIAAEMPNWDARSWWRNPWTAQFVRQEYVKLAYSLVVR